MEFHFFVETSLLLFDNLLVGLFFSFLSISTMKMAIAVIAESSVL